MLYKITNLTSVYYLLNTQYLLDIYESNVKINHVPKFGGSFVSRLHNILILSTALILSGPATAATYTATNSTLKSVFANVAAGDTILLKGNIGPQQLRNRQFSSAVTIDATKAFFGGKLMIDDVENLQFIGGRFGSKSATSTWQNGLAVAVSGGRNIGFLRPIVVGNGVGKARGLGFRDVNGVVVDGGTFTGLRQAIGINNVTNGKLTDNRITRSTSDGFNIVSSHFVLASGNSCSQAVPSAGAHPDCIQLWSIAGRPVQSDINIINNRAIGRMQGFTSFTPEGGGGLRITMSGNYINASFPNGIACYACVDSVFTDNVLVTGKGANFQTRINIIGGSNNLIANNILGARPNARTFGMASSFADVTGLVDLNGFADVGNFGGQFDTTEFAAISGVPEPMLWAQLLTGFALVGAVVRRRGARVPVQSS